MMSDYYFCLRTSASHNTAQRKPQNPITEQVYATDVAYEVVTLLTFPGTALQGWQRTKSKIPLNCKPCSSSGLPTTSVSCIKEAQLFSTSVGRSGSRGAQLRRKSWNNEPRCPPDLHNLPKGNSAGGTESETSKAGKSRFSRIATFTWFDSHRSSLAVCDFQHAWLTSSVISWSTKL